MLRKQLLRFVVVVTAAVLSVPLSTAQAASGDWSTYLFNPGRSGFNSTETTITPATVLGLKLHWKYSQSYKLYTQPIVSHSHVYIGTWNGYEVALTTAGQRSWQTFLGTSTDTGNCYAATQGVASTGTVATETINGTATSVLYVGGGDKKLYALNALTGAILWHTALAASSSNVYIWSSPLVYNGNVYITTASNGDCPLVQSKVFQVNASTGTIAHTFNVVPNGCIGAGVWGSPTIDPATGRLYFATGNHGTCGTTEQYAEAVVSLQTSDLSHPDVWRVPTSQQVTDSDFGSTPTLFHATINGTVRNLVGVANKNGILYAFDRSAIAAGPIWEDTIAVGGECPECGQGSISPNAWDGSQLYVAGGTTTINGVSCPGSLRAVNPATGAFIWQDCLSTGAVLGAVSAVPGVAEVGAGSSIVAVSTASGNTLFTYTNTAYASDAFDGAGSISNGVLYHADIKGNLYAFGT